MSTLSLQAALLATAQNSSAASAPAEQASSPEQLSQASLAILASGVFILIIWIVRRILRPDVLRLSRCPGRPNRLNPFHVLGLALAAFMVPWALGDAMKQWTALPEDHVMIIGVLAFQAVFLVGGLAVAAKTFRLGLGRGLGLSGRRWIYDTLRAVVAGLAAMPVCLALAAIAKYIIPYKQHAMLDAMAETSGIWHVLALA